jgi:hypothetical protein
VLEVKGARTNRVAPGSVSSDGTWTLTVDIPAAPLPNALIEWATTTRTDRERQRTPLEDAAGEPLFEGDRNTVLTRVAGQLRRCGGTIETMEPFLLTYNRQYCRPPLDDVEVRRVARSVASYPRAPEWTYDPNGYAAKVASAYGLLPAAEWLLAYLYRHANDLGLVRRGTRRMAEELRISHPTVTAARRQLLDTEVVVLVNEDKRYGSTFKVEPHLPLDSLSNPLDKVGEGQGVVLP